MPSLEDFKPFVVTGLALGGVYALSGVGMVVLYRATGVLNLAFGAVGAMGALLAWQLINNNGWAQGPAFLVCVLFGGAVTLLYGVLFGPPLAGRDPLVKATATLGLALILLGIMDLVWSDKARSMILPTSNHGFEVSDIFVNYTQVIAVGFGARGHGGHRAVPALHQDRHGDARAGERPRDHGHARRPGAAGRGSGVARLRARCRERAACCSPTSWVSMPPRSPSS